MSLLRTSLSLEQCLADWKDIAALCQSRPVRKRDWRTDTGYGLVDIYIDAAGLPADYRAHLNVLHGTFTCMADYWYRTSEAGFRSVPATLVHNDGDREHLERILGAERRFLVAPHPYHYVMRNYQAAEAPAPAGSVFFFPHSVGGPRPRAPVSLLLKTLRSLPAEYWPIDVCVHPLDVARAEIANFAREGFAMVCAGQRHDPLFLHRFYWMCRRRRFALSVDEGTQVLLASLTGLSVKMLSGIPDVLWLPANASLCWGTAPMEHYWKLYAQLYGGDIDQDAMRREVFRLTGGDRWLSGPELREYFIEAERWYRSWKRPDGRLSVSPQVWSVLEPFVFAGRGLRAAMLNRLSGRRGYWQPHFTDTPWRLLQYELSSLADEETGSASAFPQPTNPEGAVQLGNASMRHRSGD